jgi:hypothetical protein
MKLDLPRVLSTLALAGSGLPAFKALYDTVVDALDDKPETQDQLRKEYAAALQDADAAHRDAQAL